MAFILQLAQYDLSLFVRNHSQKIVNYRVSAVTFLLIEKETSKSKQEGKHSESTAANQGTDRDSHCLPLMSEPLSIQYGRSH